MKTISSEILEKLLWQISHENNNANIYMCFAGFLKSKGLKNLASLFEKQYHEEIGHAFKIYSFLSDMGEFGSLLEVPGVEFDEEWNMIDISKMYLEREISTTKSLNEIKQIAITETDCVSEEFLRVMISEQEAEYKEAVEFSNIADIVGEDWKAVLDWDLGI